MNDEQNEQDELRALVNEESGRLQNQAADLALADLALLGRYAGEMTLEYRQHVAQALVGVLLAVASVRRCIDHVTGEMSDSERFGYLCSMVATLFELDIQALIKFSLEE